MYFGLIVSVSGWRFYLCFIIPGTIGALVMWFVFPDTKGLPLEEVAALFGDADEVAIYQRDIEVDPEHHIVDVRSKTAGEKVDIAHDEERGM